MTPTQYVALRAEELDLYQGLDLEHIEHSGDRTALASRILKQIFHTDGVIYEGVPSTGAKARFSVPMNVHVSALPRMDFVVSLALYYEVLAANESPEVAHEWWSKVHDEYLVYKNLNKVKVLAAPTTSMRK